MENAEICAVKPQKILFIGGPGTGKSSLIEYLKEKGFCCLSEISREVTLEAQKEGIDQLFLTEPIVFSSLLLKGRIKQFEEAENLPEEKVFIDRGIPDVTAYLDFGKHPSPKTFLKANRDFRYDKIFFFPFWEEIYLTDNERYESPGEAKKIEKHLIQTYESLGYELIHVPKISVEERAKFILKHCDG